MCIKAATGLTLLTLDEATLTENICALAVGHLLKIRLVSKQCRDLITRMKPAVKLAVASDMTDENIENGLLQLSQCVRIVNITFRGGMPYSTLEKLYPLYPSLLHLKLRIDELQDGHVKKLLELFENLTSLTHLSLRSSKIEPEGIMKLKEGLSRCTSLAGLDVYGTYLGDDGVKELAEVLLQCKSLTHLDLGWNNIGPEGIKTLVEVLPSCTLLAQLNLYGNSIGPDLRAQLQGAASKNLKLTF